MNIEVQHKIGDLLQAKYSDYGSKQMVAFEVAEIITVTCLAGTQVYYRCRSINFKLSHEKRWIIERSGTHINMKEEYHKYRSDEVIPASQMIYAVLEDPMHTFKSESIQY